MYYVPKRERGGPKTGTGRGVSYWVSIERGVFEIKVKNGNPLEECLVENHRKGPRCGGKKKRSGTKIANSVRKGGVKPIYQQSQKNPSDLVEKWAQKWGKKNLKIW